MNVLSCLIAGGLLWCCLGTLHGATPEKSHVSYREFGAQGDGKKDDFAAIVKAHEYANQHRLPVKITTPDTYYIGGGDQTAVIQTDTDWGNARFILDDTQLKNIQSNVFEIASRLNPHALEAPKRLQKNQTRMDLSLPQKSILVAKNAAVKRYIRLGANANGGSAQTDLFIVDPHGNIDRNTPLVWDFDQVTKLTAYPMDEDTLSVTGGHFTTLANRQKGGHRYVSRGIQITRSNTVIDGIQHHVVETGEHSWPYHGFLNIRNCANIKVQNAVLTGRKLYHYINSQGRRSSTGTYDLGLYGALNVALVNCSQTNDIHDPTFWGIMGSNYCKNLLLDNCSFSRFDAHMGVVNATIRHSQLGHMGINAIGSGTLLLENSTVRSRHLINLRSDYGSTWEGELIIRNCIFLPTRGEQGEVHVIGGSNRGQHDFGYPCYLPARIVIAGLTIQDQAPAESYPGPALFADFNPAAQPEKFPLIKPREIILRNVQTASGKKLRLSPNPAGFADVAIHAEK